MSGHRQPRRVSVVIPTFNRAALLRQTIDAVLAQSVPADEIIIVDDGSTDGTAAMVEGLAPAMRLLRQANAGDLAARNAGLAQARGELVAFCDSDDLWRPDFLATMHRLWDAEPMTSAAFANFSIIRDGVWQAGNKFADAPPQFWDGLRQIAPDLAMFDSPIISRLIDFQPCFPSCLVTDRALFQAVGGWDEQAGRGVGCDFATILRLGDMALLGVVQTPLVGIRKHAGNHSANTEAMNLGDAMVLEHVLGTRPWLRPLAPRISASIARRRLDALDSAFARGDLDAVRAIGRLLPQGAVAGRRRVKLAVAALPSPLARATGGALGAFRAAVGRIGLT